MGSGVVKSSGRVRAGGTSLRNWYLNKPQPGSALIVLLDPDIVDYLRDTFDGMGNRMSFICFGLAFGGAASTPIVTVNAPW